MTATLPDPPPRIVIDPCVLIAAAISKRGAAAALLQAWQEEAIEVVVSPHLLEELEWVLERQKFRPWLTPEQAKDFVAGIRQRAAIIADPPTRWGATLDRGDDYLATLAAEAGARYLVSVDHHLTDVPNLRPPAVRPGWLLY
ncbi:MAG: putative toxin-antitoxin system toxin component, PIN family, partial [Candidatus Dormibacteraceae bacterium]